jgi:hypothetical protein
MAPEPPRKKGLKNVKAWLGLLLFALAFVVGAFGVAVLAVELRDDDINRLSDDVSELRDEVRDLRAALEPTPGVTPTPTPTPEPASIEAKVGASAELRGMRLTIRRFEPKPHTGSIEFTLENLDAPAESARPNAFAWKAHEAPNVVCAITLSGTIASLAPGEKLVFSVNWSCPGTPESVTADNFGFRLPVVREEPGG